MRKSHPKVLVSIQSQILVTDPMTNEPLSETMAGTAEGSAKTAQYNCRLQVGRGTITSRHLVTFFLAALRAVLIYKAVVCSVPSRIGIRNHHPQQPLGATNGVIVGFCGGARHSTAITYLCRLLLPFHISHQLWFLFDYHPLSRFYYRRIY